MKLVQVFFENNGYVFEILLSTTFFIWGQQFRKHHVTRVLSVTIGMLLVSMLWNFLPLLCNVYFESLRTAVFFVLCTAGVYFCCHVTVRQAAFCVTAAGAAQHLCFKIAKIIEVCLVRRVYMENKLFLDIIYLIFVVILEVYCGLFFGKRMRKDSNEISTSSTSVLILLIGMQLCTNLFHNLFNEYQVAFEPYTIFSLYDIICCLFLLMLQCEITRKENEQQNNIVMQHLLYQQKQQMKLSRETIDLINVKCHDIKNQIATLGSHIPKDEMEDLNRAINIYDTAFKSGNEALDILLMEKFMKCDSKKIRLDCMIDGELLAFMKQSDIYSLFGNAIDNAIEAVERIEDDEKRCIIVRVKKSRGMVLVHIENYYNGELSFKEGLPQTTKKDKRYHGFGMKSIRMIVEKYHGFFSAKSQEGIFALDILLPVTE